MIDLNKTLSYFFKRNGWSRNSINDFKQALRELDVTVTEVTYKELLNLANTSNLEPYRRYKITDFQTIHIIPNTSDVNYGPTEPIIVQAATNSDLFAQAYSLDFPQDIIYYDIDGGSHIPGSGNKGWIYHRRDTLRRITKSEDFRGIKYRRWKIGSNSLGFPTDLYCLWDTTISIGWDETVNVDDNGELSITTPDTSDYIDIYAFNDIRDFSNLPVTEDKGDIEIDTNFAIAASLDNCVFLRYDNIAGNNGSFAKVFDFKAGLPGSWFQSVENVTIINGLQGINHINGRLYDTLIASSFSISLGNCNEIRKSVFTSGGVNANTLNNQYGACYYQNVMLLSFVIWTSGTGRNNQEIPAGNVFNGSFTKMVWKHTDGNGKVINDSGYTRFRSCEFYNLTGFHITKLGSQLPYFDAVSLKNFSIQNEDTVNHINYIWSRDSSLSYKHLDRYKNESNIDITKSVSNNEVSLTTPESKIFGTIYVDCSSSSQTINTLSGSPECNLTVRPTGGNTLTINHNTGTNGIRLPSDKQSGGITLNDNDLDFADIEMVNGTPTVVNYGIY